MDFVLRYGKYTMVNKLVNDFIFLACGFGAIFLLTCIICGASTLPDGEEEWSEYKSTMKLIGKFFLIAFLVFCAVICAITLSKYGIDPEIYSIKRFLELLRNSSLV